MMTGIPQPLDGKLVLLIEEEAFLADYISRALADAGAQIIGPARTVGEAEALLARLRDAPVTVIVSVTVFDAEGGKVATALSGLGAPLLLIRKSECRLMPSALAHDVLTIPFAAYQVVAHICTILKAVPAARNRERHGPVLRGH